MGPSEAKLRGFVMLNWHNFLKDGVIKWLLEEGNPSVRYFTLRDLLDRAENDPDVKWAKSAIPTSKNVSIDRSILRI
ncbi:MAG: hypothetical protein AOA65_2020 [Candidatus Bathyarchaeota archaeon BA1]|nr:MAG: hypothetical protein AOA65_2020 [Candidatus Bathyarchaeota archaeon BA1]